MLNCPPYQLNYEDQFFLMISKMYKLTKLTQQVRKWNMMGQSLLPQLQLVVIVSKNTLCIAQELLKDFDGIQVNLTSDKAQQMNPYRLFMLKTNVYGRAHLLLGLQEATIKDHEFRERKQMIQKFVKKKDSVFIVFTQEDRNLLFRSQECLSVFGYASNTPRIIFCPPSLPQQQIKQEKDLHSKILQIYENIFRFDLVANYRIMRTLKKQIQTNCSRYLQWKQVITREQDPVTFSLLHFKKYTDSMICSFSGTYSSSSHFERLNLGKSIHWRVMELLHGIWEVEGDILQKTVDSFPLSFIEEQYKLSDYYSIGGFLPDTCFKSIFSPPLYDLRDSIMSSLEIIKQNILHHIEQALRYIFENTSIEDNIVSKEVKAVQKICQDFHSQLERALQSQIEFIHANPEDFWNYRQLNSSLYSPQQQVYIEIKYIGKAYVKRVYEGIKDSVPRYIGQSLLKQVVSHMSKYAFNNFIDIVREKPLEIVLTEADQHRFQQELVKIKQLDGLINFFSLKVSGSYMVKRFHEKKQLQWERMFGAKPKPQQQQGEQVSTMEKQNSKGLINWMKRLFKKNNERERMSNKQKPRRSASGDKFKTGFDSKLFTEQNQRQQIEQKQNDKQHHSIDEKHWLLIINTGKEVSGEKIKYSAHEGFPSRFRSSIWMYLSTRSKNYKKIKLAELLATGKVDQKTAHQIQKDVHRTYPSRVFRFALKDSLTNVLQGYSIHDPQISYTQGMNFVVAIILLTLTNYGHKNNPLADQKPNYPQIQEKAFVILKFLMEEKGLRKLMFVNADLMIDLSVRLDELIKQLSPLMHQIIEESPFGSQMLFSSPLLSCLSNVTENVHLLQRFMDMLVAYDFLIVYKIIGHFVANCEFMANQINVDNLFDIFKNKIYDEVYNMSGDEGVTKIFHSI